MQLIDPSLWRFLPLVHAVVFGSTAVVGRILIAKNRRHNAVSFSRGDSARDFVARWFYLWLPVIDGLFLAVYGFTGERGQPVLNLAGLEWVRLVGVACLIISLIWVVASQASMGAAWRMGVDADTQTELVTSGPFALSRNPVYLGIRGTMLGQLLVVGTWPVLAIWLMSELLVQIQVRFEEAHMVRLHAQRYAKYCARVRRWL
ncbi:methyltransferase family protein [Trinickia mobilis]|uniref:methyltransferase family protein n=1 Tax=Trinickia mobilis TaxID=2816356 RepID=UPI001A8D468D|nr:isoprenylcysteine carboxylmethyltransferase family protein [Trinickia mobilis]